jgi:dihydroorotase-like cyclic amidohydrolase
MLTQVNAGRMTINQYVKVASENPARVWQMYPKKGSLSIGADGDLTIVDMNKEAVIDPKKLHSKNVPTPWGGWKVKGVPTCSIVRGNVQMQDGEPVGKAVGRMQTPVVYW